ICLLFYSLVYVTFLVLLFFIFFFQAEDGIRDATVTGVQTCALPIFLEPAQLGGPHRQLGLATLEVARDVDGGPGALALRPASGRSEERRVGKECRSRGGSEY